jgi:molybdopterin molybdotransferase
MATTNRSGNCSFSRLPVLQGGNYLTESALIPLETARQLFLDSLAVLPSEPIPLEQAGGRVLAEDVHARNDIPHFDRSLMDGYAFRAEDTVEATPEHPCWFRVLEEVRAGHLPGYPLSPGTATKILTGAPIPEGADAVVRFEDVVLQDNNRVGVKQPCLPGLNIGLAGEDIAKGKVGLHRGKVITPGAAGILAAMSHANPRVFRQPRVSIVSTGDELVDIRQPLNPAKIRNSNLYYLVAAVGETGGIPHNPVTLADNPAQLEEKLAMALEESDMIITTGGASTGDYDFINDAFKKMGAEILFRKIDIRPGTATVGAIRKGKGLLGLPGNPGAASISFALLGQPLIRYIGGWGQFCPLEMEGVLADPFPKTNSRRRFLRGIATWKDGNWHVEPLTGQNAGILCSMAAGNVLIEIPAGTGPLKSGSKVKIIMQEGWDKTK